jgi:hypothetical protein
VGSDLTVLFTSAGPNVDDCFEVRKLYISGNIFPSFTPKLDFLNLQYLELASAGLTTLPSQFGGMAPNVRVLNLNFNALKDIRPLQGIVRLKKLLLAGNRLTRLRKTTGVLTKFKSLTKVDLRNNPLTVGFYLSTTEGRLVRDPNVHPCPDIDPFSLPMADGEADSSYRARLDTDTRLKRKVYEMLLGFGCPCLRELDGLVFDKDRVLERDETWERLKQLDIVRPVGEPDKTETTDQKKIVADEVGSAETRRIVTPSGKEVADKKEHGADAGGDAITGENVTPSEKETRGAMLDEESEKIGENLNPPEKETADKMEAVVDGGVEVNARENTAPQGKETADNGDTVEDAGSDSMTAVS